MNKRQILEKIVTKNGDCSNINCRHCVSARAFDSVSGGCLGAEGDRLTAAQRCLNKLNEEEKMGDFKTQQEIWKHLVEGGKILETETNLVYGFKDGVIFDFSLGGPLPDMSTFGSPENWRKYTEPFKSSTELYVSLGDVHPSSESLIHRLGLASYNEEKDKYNGVKVRITVEEIKE